MLSSSSKTEAEESLTSNSLGLNQDGSLRAQNIENEDNNVALELHLTTRPASFPGLSQQRKIKARIRF